MIKNPLISEVKKEETAPASFDEAAKLAEWKKSMIAEVKALQNRKCWRVIQICIQT